MNVSETIEGMNKDTKCPIDLSMDDYIRFCAFFDVGQPDECWEWKGCKGDYGHGLFHMRDRENKKDKVVRSARVSFFLRNTYLPDNVHHECVNSSCVNPNHLKDMTRSEHMKLHARPGDKNNLWGKFGKDHPMGGRTGELHPMFGRRFKKPEESILKGEECHSAKLTENKVREIRILMSSGSSNLEIGKLYGVREGTIWFIRVGKTWKHVKEDTT